MKKEIDYNQEGLIKYLCEKVDGIGSKTADRIAGYIEDIKILYKNPKQLQHFKKANEQRFVSDIQISAIQKITYEYIDDTEKPINEIWASILIKDFVKNALKEIRNTSLETLLINPFLVKSFGFLDHTEVINFYFYQKITRSVVTSWGFTVEGLLFCSGAERSSMPGFDMKVERDSKTIHLQIKSSPNTMSIEQVRQLNTHIQNIKDKINNIPILGMTYGTKKQINNQIQSTLINFPTSVKIGQELWDFIANEKGYCFKILDLIDKIMENEPTKFSQELEKKRILLIRDWEKQFGVGKKSIDTVLSKYL